MKLAIMQPYFLPYLGYFSLIKHTDLFVVFDTPQFIRHGWIERNRILKPGEGWQYIKVPLVKHSRETPINEIEIRNNENWRERIISQIAHYKKIAPYFLKIEKLLFEILEIETSSIVELNVYALKKICFYLNIPFNFSVFSNMNLNIKEVSEPDEWALEISKELKASEYINPPGGKAFFNPEKYINAGIDLKFMNVLLVEYNQKRGVFESGLSIIDVMMFNSVEDINSMLDKYEYI